MADIFRMSLKERWWVNGFPYNLAPKQNAVQLGWDVPGHSPQHTALSHLSEGSQSLFENQQMAASF